MDDGGILEELIDLLGGSGSGVFDDAIGSKVHEREAYTREGFGAIDCVCIE